MICRNCKDDCDVISLSNRRQTYVCQCICAETKYFIDSESLHPVAVEALGMIKVAEELEQAAEDAEDLKTKVDLAGKAGWCFAVLTMHERAARLAEIVGSNLTLIIDLKSKLTSEIRLAQIHQLNGNLLTALAVLTAAEKACHDNTEAASLLDFILQHMGKIYYDQKDFPKAVQCFENALNLRIQKNSNELMESSLQAIEACKKRLNGVTR